jgi:hypothetical protein
VDINYKLVLDSTAWTQSVQDVLAQISQVNEALNKTKSTASNAFAQSALDTDKLADKMEEIVKINGQMLIEFQKLGSAIKSATSTSEIKQLNDEIAKLKKQIDGLSSSAGGSGGGLGATMGKLRNQLYQLRIEGKQNTAEYAKLNAQLSTMQANMAAVDRAANEYRKTNKGLITSVNDTGQVAALAGANVISFGQVLSDLPYGIRGIANNLQQMTATMVTLIVQAGSAKNAMIALRSAFTGPLGIIVVIQGALAALDYFVGGMEKAKKSTNEASISIKEFNDDITEQAVRLRALATIQNELSNTQETRNLASKELVEILGKEAANMEDINGVINKYIRLQKLKAETDRLVLQIAEWQFELDESNRLKLSADQEYLKNAIEVESEQLGVYLKEILVLDKLFEKEKKQKEQKEERLKSEETFAEQWAKLQAEQYELGVQLTEEYYLKKKNAAEIDRINGVITQEEYNKEIENLELSKFDALLNLSYEYGIDITQSEANLLAQITKMQKEAYDEQLKLLEDNYKNKKKVIDQDLLNGIITEEEYAKNIENLEAQKLEELLALAEKYNINVTDADAALMAQRIKMYLAAKKEIEANAKADDKSKIAKLLGVEDKDVETILKNIRIIAKAITEIFNEVNEAAQKNNKKVIENLQEVIDETEKKIETETELQQMGLANNLQGEQDYLAQQMALREEAFERQKQLELQKLAIDSIAQLSNLITASTSIWKSTSELPQPAGAILAIATIGAMFGSFIASKAKAAELVKSQESFEEGGVVQGKRHTQGGEKFYSSDGNHMVEIEQGEYVTNRQSTSKYMDLLNAINNDEIGSHNIHKLLEGTGVTLPTVDTEIFRRDLKRATVGSLNDSKQSETTQTDLSADIKDIKRYVKDIAEKETIITDGNKTVVKQGSKTIITRRGN